MGPIIKMFIEKNRSSLTQNPYFLFFPFFFLYAIFIYLNSKNVLIEDEIRYVFFAKNLTHGYYWNPGDRIGLGNGPGYPILLMPFVALHVPLIYMKLLNAFLQYLSIIFLFKSLKEIVSFKKAYMISLCWACYYNVLDFITLLYSESLSILLVSLLLFFLVKTFQQNDSSVNRYLYLSGITMGYLALTKVIFGYVILFMLPGSILFWFIKRRNFNYRKSLLVLSIAFATTLPYLVYTYCLTHKMLYWAANSGDNLYWMSSPYKDEYGSTFAFSNFEIERLDPHVTSAFGKDSIKSHHQQDYDAIRKHDLMTQDSILKKIAVNNIRSNPGKFLQNCISNVGRILFNYPYSYTFQKPSNLLRLPPNGIIAVLILFSLVPTIINWKETIFPIRFMVIFIFLYLGGSVLGSAETRMFTVAVPILLFWITFIVQRTVRVNLRFTKR